MSKNKTFHERVSIQATLNMLIAVTCLSFSSFFSKICITNNIPVYSIAFFRFTLPLAFIICIQIIKKNKKRPKTKNIKYLFLRATFLLTSQIFLFIAMRNLSLSEALILYHTGPIFIFIFEIMLGNTNISSRCWVSLFAAILGMLFLLGTKHLTTNFYIFIGLFSGIFFALSQVTLHKLSQREHNQTILFFTYLFSSLLIFPLLLFSHKSILPGSNIISPLLALVLFFLLAGFSMLNQFFKTLAYKETIRISQLTPLLYFSIFVSYTLDVFFFKKIPQFNSSLGGILIIISIYLISSQEATNDIQSTSQQA